MSASVPKSIAWLICPAPSAILFALRLAVAVSAAIYIAMWLQLGRPFWAGLEVALMIQLLPGNTVARAAARVGGTVAAGIAALVILALFQQTPELMIVALALWVAGCTFALQLFRDNFSYAFGVVGFITGVIVMFTVSSSEASAFGVAQSRVAECVVAALTVAAVNVLFSSGLTVRRYYRQRVDALVAVAGELQALIETADIRAAASQADSSDETQDTDPHARLAALAQQILALESLRPYVHLEHPGFKAFDRLAQRLDQDLLSLIGALSSLHVYIARQDRALDTRPLASLATAAALLADRESAPERVKQVFAQALDDIRAHREALAPEAPLGDRIVAARSEEIADRLRAVAARHGLLVAERSGEARLKPPPSSGTSWPVNWPRVVRNSLAALAAVLMGGVVWLNFHEQMATIIIVALGGAVATLFSATPTPVDSAAQFAKGTVIATIVSFTINFFGFPLANGYVTYLVLTVPVLFVAGLAMSHPPIALAARIMVVVFELTLHTENSVRIDLESFAQFALGIYGAVGVAMLAFKLVIERDPAHQLRHQLRDIFKELAAGLHGPRARFEARIYDRLDQLALLDGDGRHPHGLHQAVLAAINLVLEARRLRIFSQRAKLGDDLQTRIQQTMSRIEQGLQRRWDGVELERLYDTLRDIADELDARYRRAAPSDRRRAIGRAEIAARLMASALHDYADALEENEKAAPLVQAA